MEENKTFDAMPEVTSLITEVKTLRAENARLIELVETSVIVLKIGGMEKVAEEIVEALNKKL